MADEFDSDVTPVEDVAQVDEVVETVAAPADEEEYKGPTNPVTPENLDSEPALREVPTEDDPLTFKVADYPTVTVHLDPDYDRGEGDLTIVGAHPDIVFPAGVSEAVVENVPGDVVAGSPAVASVDVVTD